MQWSSTMRCLVVLCCAVVSVVYGQQFYDSFTGKEINRTRFEAIDPMLKPVCAMELIPCDPKEPRRLDLSCNNLRYPTRGTTLTPFSRMLPPVFAEGGALRRARSGGALPAARALRVALVSDGRRPHKRFTHMLTNFNVFIAGDVTSAHDTVNYVILTRTCCQPEGQRDPRCIPIEVQEDDLHLRRSNVRCLNLTRAITYQDLGCVQDDVPRERINLAAPMLELSGVYGNDEASARRGRVGKWGRLRADVINGKEWPPSGGNVCLNNVPPRETRCHDAPSPAANSLPGINVVFLWFYRSHNAIADALRKLNPCWGDNKLYYTAREINIAYSAQITYYELMPELFGREFLVHNKIIFETEGHVDDYDPSLEPRLSIEFATATRWFHTVQEGTLNLFKPDGRVYGSLQIVDLILRTGLLAIDGNIDGITQGAFRDPSAAFDDVVDPDMGERVLGRLQFASDVISSDIMKGRDFGFPPYNQYRKACGLPEIKKFKDLYGWMDRQQVLAMSKFYEHPDDIDMMAALFVENPLPGTELGPMLACIMAEQLIRWRRADRFWYEHSGHPGAFTTEQLREVRKMTLARIICQHGDSVSAVQPQAFFLPEKGNEITDCSEYEMPDLSVFRDASCYPHPTPHGGYVHTTPYDDHRTTPRYEDTTVSDYMKQLFDIKQYTPLLNEPKKGYPKTHADISNPLLTYPNEYSDYAQLGPVDPSKLGHDDPTTLMDHGDLSFKRDHNDPLNSDHFLVDPSESSKDGYIYLGHLNSKLSLFPTKNPKVSIYPNADPIDPNHKTLNAVSIPGNSILNSKSSKQSLEYHNTQPSLRNPKYAFEKFLENYWQSSTANPFKAYLS